MVCRARELANEAASESVDPDELPKRNSDLIRNIKESLGGSSSKFSEFRTLSGKFQQVGFLYAAAP